MIFYLIRHGKTVDFDERGFPLKDRDRYVSKEGLKELEGKFLELSQELKGKNFRIFSSPLYRAKQTAKVLHDLTGVPVEAKTFKEVTESWALLECAEEVREEIICVISHEPYISQIIWEFTGRSEHVPMGSIHKVERNK